MSNVVPTPQKAPISHSGNGLHSYTSILNKICQEENIKITNMSNGWLRLLERSDERHFIMGYKFDLNSAIAADIADDKYATFEVLRQAKIPVVRHSLLYDESNHDACAKGLNSLEYARDFLHKNQNHIVIKPNNGTRGINVYEICHEDELNDALKKVFYQSYSASMCPFYEIKHEYRVIMLDGKEQIIYQKIKGRDWRFNLQWGAKAEEVADEKLRQKLKDLATAATAAIGLRFCSVDIIELADRELLVLEVNSGVMTSKFARQHPDKYPEIYAMYREAIRKMFGDSSKSMLK